MAKKKKAPYLRTAKAEVQIRLPKKAGKLTLTIVLPSNINRRLAKRLGKRFKKG